MGWDTGIFHSSICLEFDTPNRAEDSFLSPGALQRTSAISSPVQLPLAPLQAGTYNNAQGKTAKGVGHTIDLRNLMICLGMITKSMCT